MDAAAGLFQPFMPFFLPVTISDGREPVPRLHSAGCMKLHKNLSTATYDTSIHLLQVMSLSDGFYYLFSTQAIITRKYIYLYIYIYHFSLLMKGWLNWKTDRSDVGYVLHALNSFT